MCQPLGQIQSFVSAEFYATSDQESLRRRRAEVRDIWKARAWKSDVALRRVLRDAAFLPRRRRAS